MNTSINDSAARPTAVRWRILGILVVVSFIAYVLRTNLSFAAPEMIADLGLSEMQWGYVTAAFTAGYAIFQFPGGILGDRFGPRRVLTAIAIAWGLLTAATSAVPGQDGSGAVLVIASLFLVRFLVGAVHAPTFPVVNASLVRWFPPGGWALPSGLSSTGLTLGAAAGAVVVPMLVSQIGWRATFVVIAPLGILSAILWGWYARDNPREHRGVNDAEAELILAGRDEENLHGLAGQSSDVAGAAGWLRVLRNRDVLFLMLSYSSMNFVFYIVFSWFFYYLVEVRQFSATDAGFVASAQWIAGALGASLGGWLGDRMCRRFGLRWGYRWPVIIGMGASAVLLLVGALHSSAFIAVSAMVLLFFFNQLTEGPYWATSIAVGDQQAGAAGGVMNTGANVMGIINALLVPWLAMVFGWHAAIGSAAIFAVLGIGFILLVRADHPIGHESA